MLKDKDNRLIKPSDLDLQAGDRFTEMLSYFVHIIWRQDDLVFYTDTSGEVGIMTVRAFKRRFDWVYLCDRGNDYIEEIIPRFANGNMEPARISERVPKLSCRSSKRKAPIPEYGYKKKGFGGG